MFSDQEAVAVLQAPPRELDARVLHDGTRIRLLWLADADGGTVVLEACDAGSEEPLRVAVPREQALDAFTHPWVHLPPRPAGTYLDEDDAEAA